MFSELGGSVHERQNGFHDRLKDAVNFKCSHSLPQSVLPHVQLQLHRKAQCWTVTFGNVLVNSERGIWHLGLKVGQMLAQWQVGNDGSSLGNCSLF